MPMAAAAQSLGRMGYDVVIVGASVAGCTAAALYGRAGLRVALIEKHRSATAFKTLCGHFVLAGTHPMLTRTGIWTAMLAEGAHVTRPGIWTAAGWSAPPLDVPPAISLRRERLDPLLRRIAAQTPGVDLMLGQTVTELLTSGGNISGVRTSSGEVHGRLVVGADGYRSTVAALAGAREHWAPNERFGLWAYYRGARTVGPYDTRIWRLNPDVGIVVTTDDELTMLVAFPAKARLAQFQADRAKALEGFIAALPDAPEVGAAQRVSKVIGTNDYPCVRRDPLPAPGLVLVGDAALTGDPQPAVGCGWAFRAAEWLVSSTAPALQGSERMSRALSAYRRSLRFIESHDRMARREALAQPMNPIQRMIVRAAHVDPDIRRRTYLFGMRAVPVSDLLNPLVVARAYLATRRITD
jgi:2-polyprenyl-6-methoxyphenol hydroxylase-like FAD-dependent oxidoreductase